MVINVHGGHNRIIPGASGFLDEVTEDRKVAASVIQKLQQLGHTVYDCTDDAGHTQAQNLSNIVANCNSHSADLDVSIHFNAGGGHGVEVLVYSATSSSNNYASDICDAVAELGFKNRGVKVRNNLYVLKKTKAPALLVECCFVDSETDSNLYSTDSMASAIVKGITGGQSVSNEPTATETVTETTFDSYLVRVTATALNVRKDHTTSSGVATVVRKGEVYTIVDEYGNWGKLKSGAGWISLKYTERV